MLENLNKYNQKRDFEKTPEPHGESAEPGGFLRFVVQHHMARRAHYDFRLEWEGALLSWAVPKGPSCNTRDKRLAVEVEPHPLEYRNFEGTIPKGEYGGGTVMLWDEGIWEPYGNVAEGLHGGSLKFMLYGSRLRGKWALVRLKAKEGGKNDNWLLLKERDEYAEAGNDVTAKFNLSIRTGRSMAEIEQGGNNKLAKNPFSSTPVQLAKLVTAVQKGDDWFYELKYDGYRMVAYMEANSVRLISRGYHDYTNKFHGVAAALADWAAGRAMVLDGEMTMTNEEGKTDFQKLQNYLRNPGGKSPTYIVFDLLALDGEDLRSSPLTVRKEKLQALLRDAPGCLYYSTHIIGSGEQSFAAACAAELEGIIGKKPDSLYTGTRNGDWIKLKCAKRQAFVIGGFTLSDKKTSGLSSLLLGLYEGEDLRYVGRVGTGFNQRIINELSAKFQNMISRQPAFRPVPKPKSKEVFTWLQPELVAEVQFTEWTDEGLLRHPSYKGLRDQNPGEVKKQEVVHEISPLPPVKQEMPAPASGSQLIIEGIKITNPDKIIYEEPAVTKADLVRYYAQVAGRMLPYVDNRILSVVRCPGGASKSCFFKKHPGADNKAIVTVLVAGSSGEQKEYFCIESVAGLIFEAQMGTFEFHTWGSRVDTLEQPDVMVFDLDPDEGMDIGRVRQGVKDLKSILNELSLKSYLKTSGGKGYHVVVPLKPFVSWDVFHRFAKQVAQVMEHKWPDRYTSNIRKQKRTNKIFIDWIRNGRGATSIAPYSLRARDGAKVSMPIAWDELETIEPSGIDMAGALTRLSKPDPWDGFWENDQKLK